MAPARPLVVFAFALVLAGCAQPAVEAPVEAASDEVVVDPSRPAPTFEAVATTGAVGPDLNASLAAPPRLVAGEWWRIRFDYTLEGAPVEVVRVVADAHEGGYVMGMPHEGWLKEAIAYHAPAFGDVHLDLSYDTHNVRFQPVVFPLVEGATWETEFATMPLVATVESTDEYTAEIVLRAPEGATGPEYALFQALGFLGPGTETRLTYDARVHEVVRFESEIGHWEVVEHGYGFEGWVTVPRGEHTAIDYGTFGPATPGEPVLSRTVEVSGGFNRLTMMHFVLGLSPGAYRVTSHPPEGDAFVTEVVGAGGSALRFYEATDPDGTWVQEDLVAGAGATYSMGIAYHQYDIRLPDGARRADHSHEVIR